MAENEGIYLLLLEVRAELTLRVGALGIHRFAAGWYAYAGSARRGLTQRVARHVRREKALRWHVDYLTTTAGVVPLGALLVRAGVMGECELNRAVGRLLGGAVPVRGFGASDCRAGCPAHLWVSPRRIEPAAMALAMGLAEGEFTVTI